MESNKKMVLFGGLVLVLIFGMFGTYVHFTKQDIIISSEKKTDEANEQNSKENSSKKDNKNDVEESSNDDDTASNVNSQSNSTDSKTKNESTVGNETNSNENDAKNEKTTENTEDNLEVAYVSYTIVKGDTLSSIWRKNIVSYPFSKAREMIINKNDMSVSDVLKPGETLEIPFRDSKGYTKYSVKQGDNLTSIAEKLFPKKNANDVIEAITKANGSENVEPVEIDQVLLIPTM